MIQGSQIVCETQTIHDTMRLDTEPGEKIRYVFINNGYENDKLLGRKLLVQNQVYTLKNINVHSWSSTVTVEEIPDVEFNSVLFENVE